MRGVGPGSPGDPGGSSPEKRNGDAPTAGGARPARADDPGRGPASPSRPAPQLHGRRPRPYPRSLPASPPPGTGAVPPPPTREAGFRPSPTERPTRQAPPAVVPPAGPVPPPTAVPPPAGAPAAAPPTRQAPSPPPPARTPRHLADASVPVPIWIIASLALMVFAFAVGQFLGRNETTDDGDQSATGGPQVTAEPSAPAVPTDDGGSVIPVPTDDTAATGLPTVPTDTAATAAPTLPTDDGSGTSATAAPAPVPGEPTAEPTTAPQPSTPTSPQSDDLGLAVPISQPACDGRWIVLVGATTTPGQYAAGVGTLLANHPGSQYMLTRGSCSSLRQTLPDGSSIYAVYFGPFSDPAGACAKRTEAGDRAYVKVLDNSTPPERPWDC